MFVSSCLEIIRRVLPEPHAGLLIGLLFGIKTTLPSDMYEALVRSGTLHIIALSGMNISIISRMVLGVGTPFVGRRIACLGTLLLIVIFVWIVGPSPSIVRAAIMGALSLGATIVGRQYWAVYAWIVTVGMMIVFHPAWIGDISFQLSALATFGIVLFGKQRVPQSDTVHSWKEVCMQLIRDDIYLTLSAQVFTIPLIVWYFHRISIVSPIANLLIGWIIGPLTAVGWMTVLAGFVWLPLAHVFGWIDWIALEYVVRTVYFVSGLPLASIGQ